MPKPRQSLVIFAFCSLTCTAFGQASLNIINNRPQKPITNLPFTADQSVSTIQHLANGITLTREVKGHIARSSDGVVRLEGTLVATDPRRSTPSTQTWILDLTQHTATLLNSTLKTATVTHLPLNSTVTVGFLPPPGAQGPQPGTLETSNLDRRTQDGLDLVGKLLTRTIPSNGEGNDAPYVITTEVWTATQLNLVVNEIRRDPVTGDHIIAITSIHREEPDPTLFQVPEGYKVTDAPSQPPRPKIPQP